MIAIYSISKITVTTTTSKALVGISINDLYVFSTIIIIAILTALA